MSSEEETLPPHVLIFPIPFQGHLNPMLNLAHLLCLSEIHVTFIVSEYTHRRLHRNAAAFARYPGFQFRAVPDGLPEDHPRAGERVYDVFTSVKGVMVPLFREMMSREAFLASPRRRRPVTCIVADTTLDFAGGFARENGVAYVDFRAQSMATFWAYLHIPRLVEAGEIPLGGNSMDEIVKSLPGMEGFLRRRDLPGFCRVDDLVDPRLSNLEAGARQSVQANAVIFNTFQDLESPIASQIHKHIPLAFTIGPIHTHTESRLNAAAAASTLSGSFLEEDGGCIDWLNAQPQRSVVYVSFGSVAMVKRDQLLEFWHGLVNSGQRFLWVMRPGSIFGEDGTQAESLGSAQGKAKLVKWAPQKEVLNHPSVGAFLSHCGWNSTMESVVAGVPMICWPNFGDQMINSRFVSEVWKTGIDMKDTCDGAIIERAIKGVMVEKKDEFLRRAEDMAKLARKAVGKGGSSYCSMDGLVDYLKSLII